MQLQTETAAVTNVTNEYNSGLEALPFYMKYILWDKSDQSK